jgi:GT2 family glycosyltransferase
MQAGNRSRRTRSRGTLLLEPASPETATGALPVHEAVRIVRASGLFDEAYYRDRYLPADPVLHFVDPVSHYLAVGRIKGYRPSASFDADEYLRNHPDAARRGIDPLLHAAVESGKVRRQRRASRPEAIQQKTGLPTPGLAWAPLRRKRAKEPQLDVIMPVYKGHAETLQAIDSVLRSSNTTSYEFIVINDCSPDEQLARDLAAIASQGHISLLTNAKNLGFVKTVNAALSLHPERDAVLLNSDTLVFGDWLDRLIAHAGRQVATVTPFSNNASLCSYPRIFEDNPLPDGLSPRSADMLAARVNRGQSVDIPTGVGFCMYVSRRALDQAGSFDAKLFGKGYGEETDFCMRALDAGFHNLQALDVFVFHRGGVSFGKGARRRQDSNAAKLAARHPSLRKRIAQFAISDPARTARLLLDIAVLLRRKRRKAVLRFGTPDGRRRKTRESVFVAHPEPGGRALRLAVRGHGWEAPNLGGIDFAGRGSKLELLLRSGGFDRIEVHDLAGFASELRRELKRIARVLRIGLTFAGTGRITPGQGNR